MNAKYQMSTAPSITGNMIELSAGHSIAIYERSRVGWVAEFRDGRGEFMYAGTWFRFHSGALRAARTALESATPLTPEMLERIEGLHRESEAREQRMLAVPRSAAAAARRYWIKVISGLRGSASKIVQTLS